MVEASTNSIGSNQAERHATVAQMDWSHPEAKSLQCGIQLNESAPSKTQIREMYDLAGSEVGFTQQQGPEIVREMQERWKRGSEAESRAFVQAQCRNLCVGDLVAVGKTVYLVRANGSEKLPLQTDDVPGVFDR
jgi:hypothetical protein